MRSEWEDGVDGDMIPVVLPDWEYFPFEFWAHVSDEERESWTTSDLWALWGLI